MKKGIFGFGRKKKDESRPVAAQAVRRAPLPRAGYPATTERRPPEKSFAYLMEAKRQERERSSGYQEPWLETGRLYTGNSNILLNFESQINALKDAMKMLGEKMTTVYREMQKLKVAGVEKDMALRRMEFNIRTAKPDMEKGMESARAEISQNQTKLHSLDQRTKKMYSAVSELEGVLEKIKSIEHLVKVSQGIKKDLEKMEESKEHVSKTTNRLDGKFRELGFLKKKVDSAEETVNDVLTLVSDLNEKSTKFVKKSQLDEFREELNKTVEDSKKQIDISSGKLGAKVREFESIRKKVETNEEVVGDLLKSLGTLDSKMRNISHAADSLDVIRRRVAENVIRLKEVSDLRKKMEKDRAVLDNAIRTVSKLEVKTNEFVRTNDFRNLKTSLTEKMDNSDKELHTLAGKVEAKVREFESIRKRVEANKEITNDLIRSIDRLESQTSVFATKEEMGKTREAIDEARNSYEEKVQRLKERLDKVIAIKGDTLIRIGKKEFATKDEFRKKIDSIREIEKNLRQDIDSLGKKSAAKSDIDNCLDTIENVKKTLEDRIKTDELARKEEMGKISESLDGLTKVTEGLSSSVTGFAKEGDVKSLAEEINEIRKGMETIAEKTERMAGEMSENRTAGQNVSKDLEKRIKANEKAVLDISSSLKEMDVEHTGLATKEEVGRNASMLESIDKKIEEGAGAIELQRKEDMRKIKESLDCLAKTAGNLDAKIMKRAESTKVYVDGRLKAKDTEIASLSKRISTNRERGSELNGKIRDLQERAARLAKSEDVRMLERDVKEIKSNSKSSFRTIREKLMKAVSAKGEFFIKMGKKNFVTKDEIRLRARKSEMSALQENIRKGFATKDELREKVGKMVDAEQFTTDIRGIRNAERGLAEQIRSMKGTFATKEELGEHERNIRDIETRLSGKLEEVKERIKVIDEIEKGLEENARALREEKETVPFRVNLKKILGK